MRIAVLGGGITGVSAAEWLRRDGHAVTLLDRVSPGDPAQTSYGNAGVLANTGVVPIPEPGLWLKGLRMALAGRGPMYLRWRYLPWLAPWLWRFLATGGAAETARISAGLATLIGDTVEQHRALAEGTGAVRFLADGRYTYLFARREVWEGDRRGHALRAAAGVVGRPLDRAALLERDPELGPDFGFGVEFEGSGHVTDPGGYVAALFAHFRAEGGEFLATEIRDLRPAGEGVEIAHAGGTLAADRAVLALGAWSGALARRLGHEPRLESERGYHLVLERPSHRPPTPYMLADAKMVASPMEDGLRLAGLVEFAGLTAPPSPRPTAFQRAQATRLYPRLTWEGERVWMGHRPSTVDSLPLIGAAPKAPQVVFAFGAQHLGLTAGPKTGRIVSDILAGRTRNEDLAPFRVGRFDGG